MSSGQAGGADAGGGAKGAGGGEGEEAVLYIGNTPITYGDLSSISNNQMRAEQRINFARRGRTDFSNVPMKLFTVNKAEDARLTGVVCVCLSFVWMCVCVRV